VDFIGGNMTDLQKTINELEDKYSIILTHDLVAIKINSGTSLPYYIYKNRYSNESKCFINEQRFVKLLRQSQCPFLVTEGREF